MGSTWIERRERKRRDSRGRKQWSYRAVTREADGTRTKGPWRPSKVEARADRDKVIADVSRGVRRDPKAGAVTLGEFFAAFLADVEAGRVKRAAPTIGTYRHVWRKYLQPALGERSLSSITRRDVRDLGESIASDRQRAITISLLRMLLYRAVDEDRIATNPAARPKLGEQRKSEPEIATPDELEKITAVMPERYRALVWVTAYGSLRLSEAFAIKADRVDWLRRRIRIDERSVEAEGGIDIGGTKTKASTRWVTLPEWVMTELASHIERFGLSEEGLVFTTAYGRRIRQSAFRSKVWKPALAAAGIDRPLQAMNLRHSGASMIHEAGFSERDVADRLGHTSTRMASRYVRVYEDRQRRIADVLERPGHVEQSSG